MSEQNFKINRVLSISIIVIGLLLLSVCSYFVMEYVKFKSDYKLYLQSIQRLNVCLADNGIVTETMMKDYENVKRIEEKYQGAFFSSTIEEIRKESMPIMKEIERKRDEEERRMIRQEEREREERERRERAMSESSRLEQERIEQERLEQERIERERLEQERIERERLEQERIERERLEQERIERERKELERLEREKKEMERLEQERHKNKKENYETERGQVDRDVNKEEARYENERNNEPVQIENIKEKITKGTINGHEYVDLGLPSGLKWSTCNVGAHSPEDYGDYFAWGEVVTKFKYTGKNSKTLRMEFDVLPSDTINDVANNEWGASWRIPTKEEFEELINKCYWKWTVHYGVNGYLVTGFNGNSIFLPAGGDYDGAKKYYDEENGYYWTSTSYNLLPNYAYDMFFDAENVRIGWTSRYLGKSIRPVSD